MAKKSPFTIIDDTFIVNEHSNGGRSRTVLFSNKNKEKFRITVHSESYESQSYARLYKWTSEKGYECISSKNPLRDFFVDISYSSSYSQKAFDGIVEHLMKIAESF